MQKSDSGPRPVLVECNRCNSRVSGEVIGEFEAYDPAERVDYRYSFVRCPGCNQPLLACQMHIQVGDREWEWDSAGRLWPDPDNWLDRAIPAEARTSLEEARRCYKLSLIHI